MNPQELLGLQFLSTKGHSVLSHLPSTVLCPCLATAQLDYFEANIRHYII